MHNMSFPLTPELVISSVVMRSQPIYGYASIICGSALQLNENCGLTDITKVRTRLLSTCRECLLTLTNPHTRVIVLVNPRQHYLGQTRRNTRPRTFLFGLSSPSGFPTWDWRYAAFLVRKSWGENASQKEEPMVDGSTYSYAD